MSEQTPVAFGIWTIRNFLSPDECTRYIDITEDMGYKPATVGGAEGKGVAPNIRNNERVILDDADLADQLWRRAQDYIPEFVQGYQAVGINERFRFYRYDPKQFFHWHADGFHRRDNGERSRLTFMVYLNDDFVGGETVFENATIEPACGMALVFVHGLMHEGGEVLSGRKYVLRTDVMFAADPYELTDSPAE